MDKMALRMQEIEALQNAWQKGLYDNGRDGAGRKLLSKGPNRLAQRLKCNTDVFPPLDYRLRTSQELYECAPRLDELTTSMICDLLHRSPYVQLDSKQVNRLRSSARQNSDVAMAICLG